MEIGSKEHEEEWLRQYRLGITPEQLQEKEARKLLEDTIICEVCGAEDTIMKGGKSKLCKNCKKDNFIKLIEP